MRYINLIISFSLLLFVTQSMAQVEGTEGVEVRNLKELNSEFEDNFPIPYKEGVIYSQARVKQGLFKPRLYDGTKRYVDLMYSEKDAQGNWKAGELWGGDINKKFFDGAATFSRDGQKVFYTKSNLEGKNSRDTIVLKIYEAKMENGKFVEDKELRFNSDDFSCAHPTLSKDGTKLYFSSNKPGGSGGWDLYVSELIDGQWGAAQNLGSGINTPNKETFPFIDAKNNLFYSSDECGGCSEEDEKDLNLFVAKEGDDGWQKFSAMGYPFNSKADDVNIIVTKDDGSAGFLVSARSGGAGFDDIFEWEYDPEVEEITVLVLDELTKEPIADATVVITPEEYSNVLDKIYKDVGADSPEAASLTTDGDGKVNYKKYPDCKYVVNVSKELYFPKELKVSAGEIKPGEPFIIELKRIPVNVNINVVDASNDQPIPDASIEILKADNGQFPESGEKVSTDTEGQYILYNIDCSKDLRFIGSKKPYIDSTEDLNDLMEKCKGGDINVTIKLNPIILVHVYFDFDKSDIREDDYPELTNLYDLLNEFPAFTAELRGHTDSRGRDAYNQKLSEERAQAVVDWLVEKGISADRLVAVGLGESQPINDCVDGATCTELEHQLNRRTEFKLINKTIEIEEIKSTPKSDVRVDPCKHCKN